MSQSTSPSIAHAGLSARTPWISETTLARCVPWFRAVLDCLLITFGAFLATTTFTAAGGNLEGGNWKVIAIWGGPLSLGITGLLIAYFTARSNYRRERGKVLVCLSVVLMLTSGVSLVSMLMPLEEMAEAQMLVVGFAVYSLACMGMISIEKRMLAGVGSVDAVERTATVRQAFGRIFWAGLAFMVSANCVDTPVYLAYTLFNGSLWDAIQADFNEPLNFISYLSLILLVVGMKLYLVFIFYPAWSSLVEFHRPNLRPFKERFKRQASPIGVAALVFSIGSIASLIFLAQSQIVSAAPLALLAISVVSCWSYRWAVKKLNAETSDLSQG